MNKEKKELLDRFVAVEDLGIEEMRKRRVFFVFLIVIAIPLVPIVIRHFYMDHFLFGVINLSAFLLTVTLIITLRKMQNSRISFRIIAIIFLIAFIFRTYMGGGEIYPTILFLMYPTFVFFILGKKEGLILSLILQFFTLIIMINPGNIIKGISFPGAFTLRHSLTYTTLILFSYFYESSRIRFMAGIGEERKNLEEYKNSLEQTVEQRTEEFLIANRQLTKSRDRLAKSEKRYRLLADTVTDLIWSADLDLKLTYVSPSVQTIYGYTIEEALEIPMKQWHTPDSYIQIKEQYIKAIARAQENHSVIPRYSILEVQQVRKDGSIFPAEIKISFMRDERQKVIGVAGISRDISGRKAMEAEKEKIQAQLAQAQKMEALGTLVGGLAHDFNNILGGITGSVTLLKNILEDEKIKQRDKVNHFLDVIDEASDRSATIIRQLLTLSKKGELNFIPMDISTSLKLTYEICKNSFPKSIILNFNLSQVPILVMADPVQIEQVLLNLCINASHAMTIMQPEEERQGGILTAGAAIVENDEFLLKQLNYKERNMRWARINVQDTGVGISEEITDRLFEPFFTTKDTNIGTGLGLATSYSIVKQHSGHFNVISQPGKGTTFSVYIPLLETQNTSKEKESTPLGFVKGSGNVLIIDDEKFILDVTSGILVKSGYSVTVADDPCEGMDIYKKQHNNIDLVICDLSMPVKNGLEVFKDMWNVTPSIKFIIISGMIDEKTSRQALELGVKAVLSKPFTAYELSRITAEVLENK